MTYAELINAVEKHNIKSRFNTVCYCVGYLGKVDDDTLDLIRKLYLDGFIND